MRTMTKKKKKENANFRFQEGSVGKEFKRSQVFAATYGVMGSIFRKRYL